MLLSLESMGDKDSTSALVSSIELISLIESGESIDECRSLFSSSAPKLLPGSIFSFLPLTRLPSLCLGHLSVFKGLIMKLDHEIVELSKLDSIYNIILYYFSTFFSRYLKTNVLSLG